MILEPKKIKSVIDFTFSPLIYNKVMGLDAMILVGFFFVFFFLMLPFKSILKEFNPEYSLEGLVLKVKLQYFGYLMQRADSLEKTLMLGKVEGEKRKGQQRMRWVYSITNSKDVNLSKLQEIVEGRGTWCAAVHGVTKNQTWLSNWTTTTKEDNFKCHLWILFSFLWVISANTA